MINRILLVDYESVRRIQELLQMQLGDGQTNGGAEVVWRAHIHNLMRKADAWKRELDDIGRSILATLYRPPQVGARLQVHRSQFESLELQITRRDTTAIPTRGVARSYNSMDL